MKLVVEDLHAGRVAGSAAGVVILLAAFLIPFGAIPGYIPHGSTLYSAFSNATVGLPQVQREQSTAAIESTLITIVAGVLLIVAGILGAFPMGSGVLGISGMTVITIGPYLTGNLSLSSLLSQNMGYYILWTASISALALSFEVRKAANVTDTPAMEEGDAENA